MEKPKIICLCGSTKYKLAFEAANEVLTLEGKIVLSVGFFTNYVGAKKITEEEKYFLDELHKRKIDLANEVWILNIDGYIGESTKSEVDYATKLNKPIIYLWPLCEKITTPSREYMESSEVSWFDYYKECIIMTITYQSELKKTKLRFGEPPSVFQNLTYDDKIIVCFKQLCKTHRGASPEEVTEEMERNKWLSELDTVLDIQKIMMRLRHQEGRL